MCNFGFKFHDRSRFGMHNNFKANFDDKTIFPNVRKEERNLGKQSKK